jgi:hypothetical protein
MQGAWISRFLLASTKHGISEQAGGLVRRSRAGSAPQRLVPDELPHRSIATGDFQVETDKPDTPMIEKNGFEFPAALRGLIEKPPLLEGENPEHFWSFFQAVVQDQNPQGIMDWFNSIDTAVKCWEELRLRRSSAALIHSGMINALMYFFGVIQPSPLKRDLQQAKDWALKYFSKKPKEKEQVVALLAQHGITIAELQAKAAELSREPLQMFERMIAARENGRRQLRKEAVQLKTKRQNGDFDA